MKKIITLLLLVFPILLWGQDYKGKIDNNSGKYGYVDASGRWVVSPQFDYASDFENGYGRVSISERAGLVGKSGKLVVPCDYASVLFYNGQILIEKNKLHGAYDINKKRELIPCIYDECSFYSGSVEYVGYNVFRVEKGEKTGLFDINGKEIISLSKYDGYVAIEANPNGVYMVFLNKKHGVVNANGKEIIPCMYDVVYKEVGENYINVRLNGKCGLFDLTGKEVFSLKYDEMSKISEDLIAVRKGQQWGYVNVLTGEEVVPLQYDAAQPFDKGVARVKKEGQLTLIKNPLKEGNAIAAVQSSKKKDPNAPAKSNYPAPNSDIDKDIPQNTAKSENTFAFIIANENYHSEPIVPYALNDGWIFKGYCLKTLGLPAKNVRIFEDASLGKLITCVEQITEIAKAYDGDANIIFYYAGHGVPDEKKSTAYLLPIDGSGSDIATTGYSLEKLYAEINKVPTKLVTVFLDACFSGAKREDEMLASARSVAIKVKSEAPKGNMVVFSAATGDETAHQYPEKGHGLFTYFLLKKLQETKGSVTYGELSDYVTKQVKRQSVVINNKRQTPTVIPSVALGERWVGMKLK